MKILFINNDGGGFADQIDVADGTTVRQLFDQRVPHSKPEHYLIRVNRQPAAADQPLQPGDRVSVTPTKIEGAVLGTGTGTVHRPALESIDRGQGRLAS